MDFTRLIKNQQYIYFIKSGDFIKIGTTRLLKTRVQGLQISSPTRLQLLYAFPDHFEGYREITIQYKFEHLWSSGEWYWADPELLSFIDDIQLRHRRHLAKISGTYHDIVLNASGLGDKVIAG